MRPTTAHDDNIFDLNYLLHPGTSRCGCDRSNGALRPDGWRQCHTMFTHAAAQAPLGSSLRPHGRRPQRPRTFSMTGSGR